MINKSYNLKLNKAQRFKRDEFYTQFGDIGNELKHYEVQLHGKTIFCNCNDSFESNFFKYFTLNFKKLGLKKLIATSYANSPIVNGQIPLFSFESANTAVENAYAIEINEVPDNDGEKADIAHLIRNDSNKVWMLNSDRNYCAGDFRSRDCVELLKQADVVITNPPFSLFSEYVKQLMEYDKKFIIMGNVNAITYMGIFKYFLKNEIWLGETFYNGVWEFRVPNNYSFNIMPKRIDDKGDRYIRLHTVRWFTNIEIEKSHRHEFIPLRKKYTQDEYPKYDNYDAIEVGNVADIPMDYSGAMGVPVTFFDKHNPAQFDILGLDRVLVKELTGISKGFFISGKEIYKRIVIRNKSLK